MYLANCRRHILAALAFASPFAAYSTLSGESPQKTEASAEALVEQLRDLPPYTVVSMGGIFSQQCLTSSTSSTSSNCPPSAPAPAEARRQQVYEQLYVLGNDSVLSLARALQSSDANLRRNVVRALDALGGGWYFSDRSPSRIDISAALPALIEALQDSDLTVRAWAAEDIGDIGTGAVQVVPKLVELLSDKDEGVRIHACLGLRGIGPAARGALPALRQALSDPSLDVRQFALDAIASIEGRLRPAEHD